MLIILLQLVINFLAFALNTQVLHVCRDVGWGGALVGLGNQCSGWHLVRFENMLGSILTSIDSLKELHLHTTSRGSFCSLCMKTRNAANKWLYVCKCTHSDSSWPAMWISCNRVPMWLLQVRVPLRVLWGYSSSSYWMCSSLCHSSLKSAFIVPLKLNCSSHRGTV